MEKDEAEPINSVGLPERPPSFEEVVRFLHAKRHPLLCEVCQTQQWTIITPGDGYANYYIAMQYGNPSVLEGRATPVCVVRCNNCGNTKFFDMEIVARGGTRT